MSNVKGDKSSPCSGFPRDRQIVRQLGSEVAWFLVLVESIRWQFHFALLPNTQKIGCARGWESWSFTLFYIYNLKHVSLVGDTTTNKTSLACHLLAGGGSGSGADLAEARDELDQAGDDKWCLMVVRKIQVVWCCLIQYCLILCVIPILKRPFIWFLMLDIWT